MSTIDLEELKRVYPHGLPNSPHSFLATRIVQGMGINYHAIREDTKYSITNRGAWLRFLKRYEEDHTPFPQDDNIDSVTLDGMYNLQSGTNTSLAADGTCIGFQFDRPIAIIKADPKEGWDPDEVDLAIWEITVILEVDGVKKEYPSYKNGKILNGALDFAYDWSSGIEEVTQYPNISQQLFHSGIPAYLNMGYFDPKVPTKVTIRINGVESDNSVTVMLMDSDPIYNPAIINVSSLSLYGTTFMSSLEVVVHIPVGTNKTHQWKLEFTGLENGEKFEWRQMTTRSWGAIAGGEIMHFQVFPKGETALSGGEWGVTAIGTQGSLSLESNTYPFALPAMPSPNKFDVRLENPYFANKDWPLVPSAPIDPKDLSKGFYLSPHINSLETRPSQGDFYDTIGMDSPDIKITVGEVKDIIHDRWDVDPRGVSWNFHTPEESILINEDFPSYRTFGFEDEEGVWVPAETTTQRFRFDTVSIPEAFEDPAVKEVRTTLQVTSTGSEVLELNKGYTCNVPLVIPKCQPTGKFVISSYIGGTFSAVTKIYPTDGTYQLLGAPYYYSFRTRAIFDPGIVGSPEFVPIVTKSFPGSPPGGRRELDLTKFKWEVDVSAYSNTDDVYLTFYKTQIPYSEAYCIEWHRGEKTGWSKLLYNYYTLPWKLTRLETGEVWEGTSVVRLSM